MGATSTPVLPLLIALEESMNTTYRPDVDYVDGRIERRNLGNFGHGDLQFQIALRLRSKEREWSVRVMG